MLVILIINITDPCIDKIWKHAIQVIMYHLRVSVGILF